MATNRDDLAVATDAGRLLSASLPAIHRDSSALAALRDAVRLARQASRSNDPTMPPTPVRQLITGGAARRIDVVDELGAHHVAALCDVGAVTDAGDYLVAGFTVLFLRELAVIYPSRQPRGTREVYVGSEAPWLIRLAWDHGPAGGTAADLATGTGVVAAALSARYSRVVATDLSPDAVHAAALTLALNRVEHSRTIAAVACGGLGLRLGAFDLVVGNPPWVPTCVAEPSASDFLYADGGPTGMEVPRLFLDHAVDLLAPGGVGVMLVCDTTWRDGRRPLDEEIAHLRRRGFDVAIEPPSATVWCEDYEETLKQYVPDCVAAQLVGLVFSRPATRCPDL